MSRVVFFVAAIICTIGTADPSKAAPVFPAASAGDIFSGSITIDPSSPCSQYCTNAYPDFLFYTYKSGPGSIDVTIGGFTLSSQISYIQLDAAGPNQYSDGYAQWYAGGGISRSDLEPVAEIWTGR
jgi:hypothetical protein